MAKKTAMAPPLSRCESVVLDGCLIPQQWGSDMTRRMQGIDPGVVQARERFHAVDGAAGAAMVAEVARS